MSAQPKALALADALDARANGGVNSLMAGLAAAELRRLHASNAQMLAALQDINAGWKYIRRFHGDLYGVGWDRAQNKADAAIDAATDKSTGATT